MIGSCKDKLIVLLIRADSRRNLEDLRSFGNSEDIHLQLKTIKGWSALEVQAAVRYFEIVQAVATCYQNMIRKNRSG